MSSTIPTHALPRKEAAPSSVAPSERAAGAALARDAGVPAGMPLFLQRAAAPGALPITDPSDALEREAEQVAARVAEPAPGAAEPASDGGSGGNGGGASGDDVPPPPTRRAPGAPGPARAALGIGGGAPIGDGARQAMEQALGHDFASVRVHTDDAAQRAARGLHARAFTAGEDIVFGRGQYAPGTPDGTRLLAHELTHVAQQRAAAVPPHVARQVTDPDTGQAMTSAQLQTTIRPAVLRSIERQVEADAPSSYGELLGHAALEALPESPPWNEQVEFMRRADDVGTMTASPGGAAPVTIPAALRALRDALGVPDAPSTVRVSYGYDYLRDKLALDIACYLARSVPESAAVVPATEAGLGAVRFIERTPVVYDLEIAAAAAHSGELVARLELEGTVRAMIRARAEFEAAQEQSARAAAGALLGELSRRALLLNQVVLRYRTDPLPPLDTPLDENLTAAAAEIASIRETARTERATLESPALGNAPSLLTQQQIGIAEPVFPDEQLPPAVVAPEAAFPEATDAASRGFIGDLSRRVSEQRAQVDALRDRVVPRSPAYTLEEYAGVFRRWLSFFSHAQEEQNEMYQMLRNFILPHQEEGHAEPEPSAYQRMGSDVLTGPSAVSGSVARIFLMRFVAEQIQQQMGGTSPDFAGVVARAPLSRRSDEVTGSATSPDYSYAELYGSASGRSATAEASSRTAYARANERDRAERFTRVALQPAGAQQQQQAVAEGIAPDARPLVGLRSVQAQEGWSYLIDVHSESMDPDEPTRVVAREQRVVPPEVTEYLLAQRQLAATLGTSHRPRVGFAPVGDDTMRAGGVEGADATSAARFVRGEVAPPPSAESAALRASMTHARGQLGVGRNTPADDGAAQMQGALVTALQSYLDGFFAARTTIEWRVGAILLMADAEYQIGQQIGALFEPRAIAALVIEAVRVAAIMATLQSLGPIGQLAAQAYGTYLQGVSNVSTIAAVTGIVGFFHNAAEAGTFVAGRAWALMSLAVVEDLSQLFQALVMHTATAGFHQLVDAATRPRSARELADACRPLMENAESRRVLLEGVEQRIAQLREQGAGRDRSDPEYDALIAFREQLRAAEGGPEGGPRSVADPNADATLPGREERRTETQQFLDSARVRTVEERAALNDALPPEFREDVPIVENSRLEGSTVRVHYRDGEMRLEVGPGATPQHIREHAETMRELQRYEGVAGMLRRLLLRIGSVFGATPAHGTAGFEARLEIEKLERIIAERSERLSTDPALARDPAERTAIARELQSLYQQISEHESRLDSQEAGRGYVAAEDTITARQRALDLGRGATPEGYAWRYRNGQLEVVRVDSGLPKRVWDAGYVDPVDPRFNGFRPEAEGTRRDRRLPSDRDVEPAEAFRLLGGYDEGRDFGRYVRMLREVGVIRHESEVIDALRLERDRRLDDVRHEAKQAFTQRLIENLTTHGDWIRGRESYRQELARTRDPARAFEAASYREMLRVTDGLGPGDRGSIAERWWQARFGREGDATQVTVSREQMEAQGRGLSEPTRRLDRVEGSTIREIKNASRALGAEEQAQISDQLGMVGGTVQIGGEPRAVRRLVVVFTDPTGVRPNARYMYEMLDPDLRRPISFEILDAHGERVSLTSANRDVLLNEARLSDLIAGRPAAAGAGTAR